MSYFIPNQSRIDSANYFLRSICRDHKLTGNTNGVNVSIKCENHIIERLGDRSIPTSTFNTMVTRLVKYNICELIYLANKGENRINLYGDDDIMMGAIVNITSNGNYMVKLTTIYKERNRSNRKRTIKTAELILKNKLSFYQIPLAP